MTEPIPHMQRPCRECPWRQDVTPGQFPQSRYEQLACTVGKPGDERPMDAPMFACHKITEAGAQQACAGWLAVTGREHLRVRLAVVAGRLPGEVLRPKPGWPLLWSDYDELVSRMAAPDGQSRWEQEG